MKTYPIYFVDACYILYLIVNDSSMFYLVVFFDIVICNDNVIACSSSENESLLSGDVCQISLNI